MSNGWGKLQEGLAGLLRNSSCCDGEVGRGEGKVCRRVGLYVLPACGVVRQWGSGDNLCTCLDTSSLPSAPLPRPPCYPPLYTSPPYSSRRCHAAPACPAVLPPSPSLHPSYPPIRRAQRLSYALASVLGGISTDEGRQALLEAPSICARLRLIVAGLRRHRAVLAAVVAVQDLE